VNFHDGRRFCRSRGGELTSVHSSGENRYIWNHVCRRQQCWIGYTDDRSEGRFRWVDGSATVYSNWIRDSHRREPNNERHNEHYVIMQIQQNGGWNDVPGFERKYPACKKTLPTNRPTRRPTSFPTIRPTDIPTLSPTPQPTDIPTLSPTPQPTDVPTLSPTLQPTDVPTLSPTPQLTDVPTLPPTPQPTDVPTLSPTPQPSDVPTLSPTPKPTDIPTLSPTPQPTDVPTLSSTPQPSNQPTKCSEWTKEVAAENCSPNINSKAFGVKACDPSLQLTLEDSLAKQLYANCRSKCVYEHANLMDYNNIEGAFFYKGRKKCYTYQKKRKRKRRKQCLRKWKYFNAMKKIKGRPARESRC